MSYRTLLALLVALLTIGTAAAQETAQEPITLNFYTHPTDRWNVLIPPGWDNQSTDDYALLVNETLGAEIYALSAPTTDVDAALAQAILLFMPDAGQGTPLDEVNLTTGAWQQRAFQMVDGSAAVVYAQVYEGRTYLIIYRNRAGALPFVVRTESRVADSAGAQAALSAAFAQVGVAAGDSTSIEAPTVENGYFRARYDGYSALTRSTSVITADVILAPGDGADAAHGIAFTVVRDFFLTPQTDNFLVLGMVASFGILALFIASLLIRRRNLARDEETLRTLET
ncbi:MAG: hypothetical protein SF123_13490 [Chloroflexota bacterium]|nr:hypothetical protein [Chloroflexota bacterium]